MFLFVFGSCDQIHYSPFETSGDAPHLTSSQLSRLASRETATSYPFKVAFISDTHNDYKEFQGFVEYINKHSDEYSLVVHCGDLTTFATEREYKVAKKILGNLNIPYFVLPGNHDLIANGPTLYKNYFGAKDFTFAFKDVRFVLFSNNNFEDGGSPRINWIKSVAETSTESWKIFATHIPPVENERFTASEIDALKDIMDDEGVDYIFNGHIHSDGSSSSYSASSKRIDVGHATRTKRFRVLTFDGAGISESTVHF